MKRLPEEAMDERMALVLERGAVASTLLQVPLRGVLLDRRLIRPDDNRNQWNLEKSRGDCSSFEHLALPEKGTNHSLVLFVVREAEYAERERADDEKRRDEKAKSEERGDEDGDGRR
eukprot:PDM80453.1 hypothetical protein PRIPAC_35445 [Pristionchus pacificus]